MRRILSLIAVPLAAAALIGAGCGGGGGGTSSGAASTGASQASSGDAAAILSSIKPGPQQGAQKIGLNLDVVLNGAPKDPSVSALLGSGPITLDLSGPVDAAGKKADLTFDLKAGKISLKGGLRVLDDKAYIQLADKWYELPLQQAQSEAATSSLDPNKVLEAIGDPSALVKNARVVGAEDVDGIATDHVAGDVDTAEFVKAISRVAKQLGTSTTTPIDEDQIAKATAQIEKYVKSAKVDLWVGQQSKQVNKFKLAVAAVLDESTKASSGLDGFTAALTVSATPTDEPDVTKPEGALPSSQLQTDIGPIILGGLGGATP